MACGVNSAAPMKAMILLGA
jgi:hypothetical protein